MMNLKVIMADSIRIWKEQVSIRLDWGERKKSKKDTR
jgi:hypothetical protein